MKKSIFIFWLLSLSYLYGHDQNLIIIVDSLHQESIDKTDITATHQLVTALQQKAAPILVSTNLWKNVVDRDKSFSKKMDDSSSVESAIYNLYQSTNQELKLANYDIAPVNQKLSSSWYAQNYSQLKNLSQAELDQLKFNFFCYNFDFDFNQWLVFDFKKGMLLFVPINNPLQVDPKHQVLHEHDLVKHPDKKNNILENLQFLDDQKDRWVIYLSGHGNPLDEKQKAHVAGLPIKDFSSLLSFLNNFIKTKLLVYSSCYAGGVHTVEPYQNMILNYPVIVIALTDAPIYGFGLFEGAKLPPFDVEFKLEAEDVQRGIGLLPSTTQYFHNFFKQAHRHQHDLSLISLISQFYNCDQKICSLQKIENIPLMRSAHATHFLPMDGVWHLNLVDSVTTDISMSACKPLLLYKKKIETIDLTQPVPLISMLPGLHSHEIGRLQADTVVLSKLINECFLSVDDAQKYKNYLVRKVSCINDLVGHDVSTELTHLMVIQNGFIPRFVDNCNHVLISFQCNGQSYCAWWDNKKCKNMIVLNSEQVELMHDLENFLQKSIDFQSHLPIIQSLEFDAYLKNKHHHQTILDLCIEHKICRK